MEHDPFIDDFPIKTSIYNGFSMAMLNNQMVLYVGLKIGYAFVQFSMADMMINQSTWGEKQ